MIFGKQTLTALIVFITASRLMGCGSQTATQANTDIASNKQSSGDTQAREDESMVLSSFTGNIGPNLPQYVFKLYGEQDQYEKTVTKILVSADTENKLLIQEIPVAESGAPLTLDSAGVSILDVNFDGYNDLMIRGKGGSGANVPYTFWLWNNALSQFTPSEVMNGLISPVIDSANKTIISENSSAAGSQYTKSYYQFIGGQFTLVKETERVADMESNTFKFTVSELKDGKMTVTHTYSEPIEE